MHIRNSLTALAAMTVVITGCDTSQQDRDAKEANAGVASFNARLSSLQAHPGGTLPQTTETTPKLSDTPAAPHEAVCPAPAGPPSDGAGTRTTNTRLGFSYILPDGYHEKTEPNPGSVVSLEQDGNFGVQIFIGAHDGETGGDQPLATNEDALRYWYKMHHDAYDFDYPSDQFTQWDGPNLPGAAYQGEEKPNRPDKPNLKDQKSYWAYVGCQARRWSVSSSTGNTDDPNHYDPKSADIVARSIRELRP